MNNYYADSYYFSDDSKCVTYNTFNNISSHNFSNITITDNWSGIKDFLKTFKTACPSFWKVMKRCYNILSQQKDKYYVIYDIYEQYNQNNKIGNRIVQKIDMVGICYNRKISPNITQDTSAYMFILQNGTNSQYKNPIFVASDNEIHYTESEQGKMLSQRVKKNLMKGCVFDQYDESTLLVPIDIFMSMFDEDDSYDSDEYYIDYDELVVYI